VRPRLVKNTVRAADELPAPSAAELARYWEHCTHVLALSAIEVQSAWLEVLELLEARAVLVVGQVPPDAIVRMDKAVRALSDGPVKK
jgi:hypothetical protein